jgi:hypothetical protein
VPVCDCPAWTSLATPIGIPQIPKICLNLPSR